MDHVNGLKFLNLTRRYRLTWKYFMADMKVEPWFDPPQIWYAGSPRVGGGGCQIRRLSCGWNFLTRGLKIELFPKRNYLRLTRR